MRRWRYWPLALLPAAVIAVLAGLPGLEPEGEVPSATVVRERFVWRVAAEGELRAAEATAVGPPVDVPGPLRIAWLAPDGTLVEAGDVIARFDPAQMQDDLYEGETDRQAVTWRRRKRIAEKQEAVHTQEKDAALARLELDYALRFASRDAEIFSRGEILESELDEQLAQERLRLAEAAQNLQEALAGLDLELLAIEAQKAQLRIERARQGLQTLELRAPHAGILVFERDWRGELPQVGESVWGGQRLADIARPEKVEAEVLVLEADAGGLREGAPAQVILESDPETPLPARVRKVDALARPRLRWVPVQYVAATLQFDRTDPGRMRPGQRVRAEIVLAERDQALVVPREAVVEREGARVVYRRAGRGFEPVEVVLGPAALGRVVVEQGLEEGDEVALRDPEAARRVPEEGPSAPSLPGLEP